MNMQDFLFLRLRSHCQLVSVNLLLIKTTFLLHSGLVYYNMQDFLFRRLRSHCQLVSANLLLIKTTFLLHSGLVYYIMLVRVLRPRSLTC